MKTSFPSFLNLFSTRPREKMKRKDKNICKDVGPDMKSCTLRSFSGSMLFVVCIFQVARGAALRSWEASSIAALKTATTGSSRCGKPSRPLRCSPRHGSSWRYAGRPSQTLHGSFSAASTPIFSLQSFLEIAWREIYQMFRISQI